MKSSGRFPSNKMRPLKFALVWTLIGLFVTPAFAMAEDQSTRMRRRSRGPGVSSGEAPNPIDAMRKVNWSSAGAGIVPARLTQCGATISPYGTAGTPAPADTINAAIQSCPPEQHVQLGCGTFYLSDGVDFAGKNYVTLRGCGPQEAVNGGTTLVFFNTASCLGLFSPMCLRGPANYHQQDASSWQNYADITTTIHKGDTSFTVGTPIGGTAPIIVGKHLILDRPNDISGCTGEFPALLAACNKYVSTGELWPCESMDICSDEGGGAGRPGRSQHQILTVTGVTANGGGWDVTFSPAIALDNWVGASPQVWWANNQPGVGMGVEHLKIDMSNIAYASYNRGAVVFANLTQSWMRNVFVFKGGRANVLLWQSTNVTIRDNYIHQKSAYDQQSYGIEWYIGDYNLIENNILNCVAGALENNSGVNNVLGYNFIFEDCSTNNPAYLQVGDQNHAAGVSNNLHEGEDSTGAKQDGIHGTSNHVTVFRSRLWGCDTGKTSSLYPVQIYAWNYFGNYIGNVLGCVGVHTNYEGAAGNNNTIWHLGADPCSVPTCLNGGDDFINVKATLFRWGNCDIATLTCKFDSAEVPTGLAKYSQAIPSTQSLPASFYLSGQPPFWVTPFGTPPWPAIGPNVSGGNLANSNGWANKIPARLCYENTAKTGTTLTAFDARACYGNY